MFGVGHENAPSLRLDFQTNKPDRMGKAREMLDLANWRGCVKIGGFGQFGLYQIETIMFVLKATFYLT
jgi:hypothetical protein